MKLKDLFHDQVTIIDIFESLNFETPIDWKDNIGYFKINNHKFGMQVRPATSKEEETFRPFFQQIPKVGNVDFWYYSGDGTTQDTTGIAGSIAMKVFSVVAQGVREQVKKHRYDILLCVAKRKTSPTNFKNRVAAFETIVDRATRKAGMQPPMVLPSDPDSKVFVVYHPKYFDNMLKVKEHLKQYYGSVA